MSDSAQTAGRWAGRLPIATLALSLGAALVAAIPGAEELVQYERARLWTEPWRILLCHFAHFSPQHLRLDLVALLFLGSACEHRAPRAFTRTLVIAAVAIPIAVHALLPGLETYRGLSGLDSALFALLVRLHLSESMAKNARRIPIVPALAATLFLGKLAYEVLFTEAVFVTATPGAFVPVPLAHAVGAAAGFRRTPYRRLLGSPGHRFVPRLRVRNDL